MENPTRIHESGQYLLPFFKDEPPRHRKIWGVIGLALLVLIIASLFSLAYAQQRRLKVGEVITANVALCKTAEEAGTLLTILAKQGKDEALAYMDKDDNTCSIAGVAVKIGSPVGNPQMVDGRPFVVLSVSDPTGSVQGFIVIPANVLQLSEA